MHKYIYLFIIFLLYQTSSFSKVSDVNKFDQKNLSNYFSGIVASENRMNSEALKFFNSSKLVEPYCVISLIPKKFRLGPLIMYIFLILNHLNQFIKTYTN